jgi:hypothetical protein
VTEKPLNLKATMEQPAGHIKERFQGMLPDIAFIIGMGRSGTTLLTNMFNSNPEVVSTPENEFIVFSKQSFQDKDFSNEAILNSFMYMLSFDYSVVHSIWKPSSELASDIRQLKEKNFANVCKLVYLNYPFAGKEKKDIKLIVDKNPVYSLHLETLSKIYPEAKYIVLTRDHRDNVLSRKKYGDKKKSVFEFAVSWNYYYERIFSDLKKYGLKHHLVRYEDLVADPAGTLRSLCSYLGIDYSENMLEFQDLSKKIKAHVKESSSAELFDKINKMHSNLDNNVNPQRIKAYEKELTTEEIRMINYVCSHFAHRFGYLDKTDAENLNIPFSWKFNKLKYNLIVKAYYAMRSLYYKAPVNMRLSQLRPSASKGLNKP